MPSASSTTGVRREYENESSVTCCDNSPNKPATKNFHTSQHPLIQSFEPGEDWAWCYIDEIFLEPAHLQKALR